MNELIKVNYENDKCTVLGRDLHSFLEVDTPYHIWFPRMCEYGFNENIDFSAFKQKCSKGRPSTDHEITIDMAKEISMLQRTDRGKQARQYFLELERQWNTPEVVMARALKFSNDKILQLETQIKKDKPKVLFADAVETSESSILIGDLAKLLKQNGVNTGQKRLFQWLRDNGYLIKSGSSKNMPTQKSMDLQLFEVKERTINNPDGSIRVTRTTKVTGKGQVYFINRFVIKSA